MAHEKNMSSLQHCVRISSTPRRILCESVILTSPNISKPTNCQLLTQQNDDTGQYSYQRPRAETGWQDVGLHIAGEDGVFTVTGADSDGQGVGAAHSRETVVIYLDGKVVNILGQAAESFAEHVDAGCAVCVCGGGEIEMCWSVKKDELVE